MHLEYIGSVIEVTLVTLSFNSMITDKLINLHRFGSVDIIGYKFFIKQKEHSESMRVCKGFVYSSEKDL